MQELEYRALSLLIPQLKKLELVGNIYENPELKGG